MTVHASDFDGYVFVGPPRPQQDGEEDGNGEREPPEEVRADKDVGLPRCMAPPAQHTLLTHLSR